MKTVKIPSNMNPYVVEVNGRRYVLKAGETMTVEDEVADAILSASLLAPKTAPTKPTVADIADFANVAENANNADKADLAKAIDVLTVAPTSAYSGVGTRLVHLEAEPANRYDGYIYIIDTPTPSESE